MDKVKLHDKVFKLYLGYDEIKSSIDSVAEKINGDFRGSDDVPVLLCVMNGAIMFTSELMKRLDFDLELMSIKLSSYEGMSSSGKVKEVSALSGSVKGRRVIISEDIVDTGTTIKALVDMLLERGAKEVRICTMLLKKEIFKADVTLDYVAREIPNDFIVGFGLDYDELGRNLKDIYILDE